MTDKGGSQHETILGKDKQMVGCLACEDGDWESVRESFEHVIHSMVRGKRQR